MLNKAAVIQGVLDCAAVINGLVPVRCQWICRTGDLGRVLCTEDEVGVGSSQPLSGKGFMGSQLKGPLWTGKQAMTTCLDHMFCKHEIEGEIGQLSQNGHN